MKQHHEEEELSNHTTSTSPASCEDDLEDRQLNTLRFRSSRYAVKHEKKEKLQNHYELLDFLGSGGFGSVFKCRHLKTGQERAVKIIKKDKSNKKQRHQILQEFKIHSQLDHPSILQALELFEDKHHYCLVTELCLGGDLHEYVYTHGPLKEEQVAVLVQKLLSAVHYCHEHNLVHRDLKPENLLLQYPHDFQSLKLLDFGLTRIEKPGKAFQSVVGSPFYVSPQVVQGRYHRPCDLWAIGTIAYTLLAGKPPFEAESDAEVLERISIGWVHFDDPAFDDISQECTDLLRDLMAFEEVDRPTAQQAIQHSWFQQVLKANADTSTLLIPKENDIKTTIQAIQQYHNHDCKIQQATVALLACHYRTQDATRDAIYRALDPNAHGRWMNYSEFVGIVALQRNPQESIQAIFQHLDPDQKGYLTLTDIQEGFRVDESIAKAMLNQLTQEHQILSKECFQQAVLLSPHHEPDQEPLPSSDTNTDSPNRLNLTINTDPSSSAPSSSSCNNPNRQPIRRSTSLVAGAA